MVIMKTITIDRSKWRCGHIGPNALGMGETQLKNNYGYMCCLGQWIEQTNPDLNVASVDSPQRS